MSTLFIKTVDGRVELWSRDDKDDFVPEALARAGIDYEDIDDEPLSDAQGFRVASGLTEPEVRQFLTSTNVTLDWVDRPLAAPPPPPGGPVPAGPYVVSLDVVQGTDRLAVTVRDVSGDVIDPARAKTLGRDVRPKDAEDALPPDTAYHPTQIHHLVEAVRNRYPGA